MRTLVLAVVVTLACFAQSSVAAPSATGSKPSVEEVFNNMQNELMCLCGCNSMLKKCPHINCGFAIPERKEILSQLKSGKSKDEVITYLVEKHGEQILSAPTKKGFNLVGYATPFIAIVLVGSLVGKTVSRWVRRGTEASLNTSAASTPRKDNVDKDLAERLKKELADFDD